VSKPICTTKILLLSNFAPELKTRDLIAVFAEWEDQNGGFRIKWVDDRSAYIVFQEATTAKKAFLATLANPPPSLAAAATQPAASILPYNGPEAESILSSVATRPRSRSIAGGGHAPMSSTGGSLHARRSSNSGAPPSTDNGHIRRSSFANSAARTAAFPNGANTFQSHSGPGGNGEHVQRGGGSASGQAENGADVSAEGVSGV